MPRNTFELLKYAWTASKKTSEVDSLCRLSGPTRVPGVLTYRKQHLHTVFHGLRLREKGKEMCDRVWRVQQYYSKVSQPCFFPSTSLASVYLAPALKRFHENSEAEQVGVVAPGVGTAKHDEDATREGFFFFFVICASAAYKHCQAVIIYAHCVAHIQNDNFSGTPTPWHVNTLVLMLVWPESHCCLFALLPLSEPCSFEEHKMGWLCYIAGRSADSEQCNNRIS